MTEQEIINELFNIIIELDARNQSNNCINQDYDNKSWKELCETGSELFNNLK